MHVEDCLLAPQWNILLTWSGAKNSDRWNQRELIVSRFAMKQCQGSYSCRCIIIDRNTSRGSKISKFFPHLTYDSVSLALTTGSHSLSLPVRAMSRQVRSKIRDLLCSFATEAWTRLLLFYFSNTFFVHNTVFYFGYAKKQWECHVLTTGLSGNSPQHCLDYCSYVVRLEIG